MPYCSKCGKQVNQTAKFCKACGFEIDSGEVKRAQTTETETHPAVNEKPSGISTTKEFSGRSALSTGSLIVSLIFGILTIICFFLPWGPKWSGDYTSYSGWEILVSGELSLYGNTFYAAYWMIVSSIIMVVFTSLAIVKQGIQRIFVKIALLAAFIALGASISSCIFAAHHFHPHLQWGVVTAGSCCLIGFLALLIADWQIWRRHRFVR